MYFTLKVGNPLCARYYYNYYIICSCFGRFSFIIFIIFIKIIIKIIIIIILIIDHCSHLISHVRNGKLKFIYLSIWLPVAYARVWFHLLYVVSLYLECTRDFNSIRPSFT